MEATMKLSNNIILNRRLHYSLLSQSYRLHHHRNCPHLPTVKPQCPKLTPTAIMLPRTFSRFSSSIHSPVSNPLTFLLSLSISYTHLHFHNSINQHDGPIESEKDEHSVFTWNRAAEGDFEGRVNGLASRNRVVTVVLLGWLGAEPKHLRKYAELYNSQGIHAVNFVVPVSEVLCFDLGRRVERRITELANELAFWVSESDGDRCLIFHTFSNTGWLVYGSILDRWRDRPELNQKIKGCIVDSGGDPELNPKVWAAGFSAAILKKRSSLTKPSTQGLGAHESDSISHTTKVQRKESDLLESMVVLVLETLFFILLNLPDVNKRLMKIIGLLSEKPPPCPQLYLYSTSDKVIPYHSVESFMEIQRTKGMDVDSFNFQSSPHVDHFRTFSDLYTSVLHKFLKKCLSDK
ncbi:hypothetical protein QQ045_016860 [Rhodiola kirilowii]